MKRKKIVALILVLVLALSFNFSFAYADNTNKNTIVPPDATPNYVVYCQNGYLGKHERIIASGATFNFRYDVDGQKYFASQISCKHCGAAIVIVNDYPGYTYRDNLYFGFWGTTCNYIYPGKPIDWDTTGMYSY